MARATIGQRLKRKRTFNSLSEKERYQLRVSANQITALIWKHINENNLYLCKDEGDEIAIMFSFRGESFEMYCDDENIGSVKLYNFSENIGIFYVRYVSYINMILKKEGIKLEPMFTEYPVIFKVILL